MIVAFSLKDARRLARNYSSEQALAEFRSEGEEPPAFVRVYYTKGNFKDFPICELIKPKRTRKTHA